MIGLFKLEHDISLVTVDDFTVEMEIDNFEDFLVNEYRPRAIGKAVGACFKEYLKDKIETVLTL